MVGIHHFTTLVPHNQQRQCDSFGAAFRNPKLRLWGEVMQSRIVKGLMCLWGVLFGGLRYGCRRARANTLTRCWVRRRDSQSISLSRASIGRSL